jgi:hypothetical protein
MSRQPLDQLQRRVLRQVVRSLFLTFVLILGSGAIGWTLHAQLHPCPAELMATELPITCRECSRQDASSKLPDGWMKAGPSTGGWGGVRYHLSGMLKLTP